MNEAVLNTSPSALDVIAQQWREAKADEDAARARRLETEKKLIDIVGVRDEGTTSIKSDYFRVTTTGKMNRSLDQELWEDIKGQLPHGFRPVRYKVEINLSELRSLEKYAPAEYRLFARALTVSPAKTSVSVEVLS